MNLLAKNLGYLLWKLSIPWENWVSVVADWVRCDKWRAKELLLDGKPRDEEVCRLAEKLKVDPSDLIYQDLLELDSSVNVLRENLRRLLNKLPHGSKRDLANQLGVEPITLSRWLAGSQKPRLSVTEKLKSVFHIPPEVDLKKNPLFARFEPIGIYEQRMWLHQRIDQLDVKMLDALQKLLDKS